MRILSSFWTLEVFGLLLSDLVARTQASAIGRNEVVEQVWKLGRRQAGPGNCGVGTIECADLAPSFYCCPANTHECSRGQCKPRSVAPPLAGAGFPGGAPTPPVTISPNPQATSSTPNPTSQPTQNNIIQSTPATTNTPLQSPSTPTTESPTSSPAANNNQAAPVLTTTQIAILSGAIVAAIILGILIAFCLRKRKQGKHVLATYESPDRPQYSRVVVERGNRMSVYSPEGKKIAESTASSSNSSRVSLNIIPATPPVPPMPQQSMQSMQPQQSMRPMQPQPVAVVRTPSAVSAISSKYYPTPIVAQMPPGMPVATARGGEDSPTVWDRPQSIYSPVSPIESDPRNMPFANERPDTAMSHPPLPKRTSTYSYTPHDQQPAVRALTRTMTTGASDEQHHERPTTSSSTYSFSPPSSRSESRASTYMPYRPGRVSVAYPHALERAAEAGTPPKNFAGSYVG